LRFNGLGLNDIEKLKLILEDDGIAFSIEVDDQILQFNEAQKNETLAHYLPGRVSTNLLSLIIKDEDFDRISSETMGALSEFGLMAHTEPHASEFEVLNEDDPAYLKEHKAKKERFINLVLINVLLLFGLTYLLIYLNQD